jgi:lipoprotein signal peptidase
VLFRLAFRDVTYSLNRLAPARTAPAAPVARPRAARHRGRPRPAALILSLLATVVVLDQATKWWAWRHVPWALINPGGDLLSGSTIGGWYAAPVSGALLDVLDVTLLTTAVLLLTRWRTAASVSVPATLMIGGWSSNVLDRVGLHYWTAPGSARGAVDFIHIGGYYYNVADFFIIGCTPLFLLAVVYQAARAAGRGVKRATIVSIRDRGSIAGQFPG